MKRYSFIYTKKDKRIADLIEYLEENYGFTFLEIIDLNPLFSFNLKLLNISNPSKEIMFKWNPKIKQIYICNFCNFPVALEDLEPFEGTTRNEKACKNCFNVVYERGKYFNNKIKRITKN